MPVPLSPEAARLFLETDQAPAPHLDFLNAASFRTAGAAQRLGVFDALADGPVPVPELAGRLDVSERGLGQLLHALAGFGYVTTGPDGWANTAKADKWLRDVPGGYGVVFRFWHTVLTELWSDLEQSVRTGEPAVDFYQWLGERPPVLRAFQTMLSRLADALTPEVLEAVPVAPEHRRLLDIGGGHATYTTAFCQRYPELTATVLDLPEALEIGREAVATAGLTDRVAFRAGDLGSVRFPPEFDLALLFNIVHGMPPERVRELFRAVADAIRPGGRLVVLEPLSDLAGEGGAIGEAFVHTFSLNLFHSQGGQIYGYPELAEWLAEAGFTDLSRYTFRTSPTDHLVIAVRG